MADTELKTVHLDLPASTDDLARLELGTVVYLDGRIFTAREGVYKRAVEEGGSYTVGAVTATASFRFAKTMGRWLEMSGCNIVIGKAGMTSEIYRRDFVPNKAIYLTTVGYGTGALLGRGVKSVAGVYWLEELGLAQAVWALNVENFGPFLVEGDLAGNSLFERENAKTAAGIEALYAGTRPPALHRYGETDDKTEELI